MAEFPWRDERKEIDRTRGPLKARPCGFVCALLLGMCLILAGPVQAQEKRVVAVLPFGVNTPKPMDHLRLELQQMFTARMAREAFPVVNPREVNKHPKALLPRLEPREILDIGHHRKLDTGRKKDQPRLEDF
jgi:hypothetical protein